MTDTKVRLSRDVFGRAADKAREPARPTIKGEVDQLEANRALPRQQMHLRPGGWHEQEVHEKIETDREKRIKPMKRRLSRVRHRARDDFERSR